MTPDEMAALHARCFVDSPWSAQSFAALQDTATLFAAPRGCGFLLASILPPEVEILTLAVAPDHQRQGHGSALLAQLQDHTCTSGITDIILEVAADNTTARAFYARHGFAQDGRRKAYFRRANGVPVDALLLRCTVPPQAPLRTTLKAQESG